MRKSGLTSWVRHQQVPGLHRRQFLVVGQEEIFVELDAKRRSVQFRIANRVGHQVRLNRLFIACVLQAGRRKLDAEETQLNAAKGCQETTPQVTRSLLGSQLRSTSLLSPDVLSPQMTGRCGFWWMLLHRTAPVIPHHIPAWGVPSRVTRLRAT